MIASVSEDDVRVWSVFMKGKSIYEYPSNGKRFQSVIFHLRYPNVLVIGGFQVNTSLRFHYDRCPFYIGYPDLWNEVLFSYMGRVYISSHLCCCDDLWIKVLFSYIIFTVYAKSENFIGIQSITNAQGHRIKLLFTRLWRIWLIHKSIAIDCISIFWQSIECGLMIHPQPNLFSPLIGS